MEAGAAFGVFDAAVGLACGFAVVFAEVAGLAATFLAATGLVTGLAFALVAVTLLVVFGVEVFTSCLLGV